MKPTKPHTFAVLVGTATIAGFATCYAVNMIHDFPEVVDWCIAASAGYLAAEIVELLWCRRKKAP